jgi:His/Glu/Gln/Arg/opine family amino acid ABC transporter permease subunit
MASNFIEKEKTSSSRSPQLLIYIGFLFVAALIFALLAGLLWASTALDFLAYLANPEVVRPFAATRYSGLYPYDGLTLVILSIQMLGFTILLGLSIWIVGAVMAFARGTMRGYRTVLTIAVALPILSFIFFRDVQITLFERLTLSSTDLIIITLINLLILFLLAHFRYYPEYRRMSPGEITRDLRVIRVVSQIIFAFLVLSFLQLLGSNIYSNLLARNIAPSWEYLTQKAGFQITVHPEWYTSSDSYYGDAFMVGVINTINVVWIGLVLSTIIGIFLGIFLLSRNWLIRQLSTAYVEVLRNTPLLVQLHFWYFVLWFSFPDPRNAIAWPSGSVMVVFLRFFPYLFTILGVWFYAWRFENAPPRLLNGVLTAVLLLEVAFYFLGDSYGVIIALAVIGAALIFAAKRRILFPETQEGFVLGIGILALCQFVGHLMLDGLAAAGVIEHARFVYGDAAPIFIVNINTLILPEFVPTLRSGYYDLILLLGAAISIALYIWWGRIIERTGRNIPRSFYAVLLFVVFAVGGWYICTQAWPSNLYVGINREGPYMIYEAEAALAEQAAAEQIEPEEVSFITSAQAFVVRLPERNSFGRVEVGTEISAMYMALLLGLVVYTSAFIGEIVRAGIQAVPYGQIEAARALGLGTGQTLRMIVLPQALRVIIPPLGNQYLNLAKNSSLAAAIAYTDLYQVGTTIMNQSGQSITGFLIILLVYLTMSLLISYFVNLVNARFQLVTR